MKLKIKISRTPFLLFVFFLAIHSSMIQAQDNRTLFSVEDIDVSVSEFTYIYGKHNGEKADYSESSLAEYLDLYKKFKLKIKKAKELGIDKEPTFQQELDGYKKQLSNTYLLDREVTEKLLRQAYDRSKEDVNVSHILLKVVSSAAPKDTLKAYNLAKEALAELNKGGNFSTVAKKYSNDPSVNQNGGNLGFYTVFSFNNLYPFENAMYQTPVGKYSNIFRTGYGYHILKVEERRPARGQVRASHILARVTKGGADTQAKTKIDEVYALLQKGGDFAELAKTHSDDQKTANKGGSIGQFGINTYESAFENAAFGIKKDGDYSLPFKSELGWHIIKLEERIEALPYELARSMLLGKVKRDSRYQLAQDAMVANIKKSNNFVEANKTLTLYKNGLDKNFVSPEWKPATDLNNRILFTLGKTPYKLKGFQNFLVSKRSQRVRMGRSKKPAEVAEAFYQEYLAATCIKYEESQLETKYPDFRSLMREYEEGNLLFYVSKDLVWDKASQDTIGLEKFYENNSDNYTWEPQAKATKYLFKKSGNEALNKKMLAKTLKLCKSKSSSVLLSKINKNEEFLIIEDTQSYDKGKNKTIDAMTWEKGSVSEITEESNQSVFYKIEEISQPRKKEFKDARGYVIADYQDYLEKEWVKELENTYKVSIDQKVFKSLIK